MPTIKNLSDSGYTKVSNKMLADEHLDWKEIGMLTYLMSLPPDWKINKDHLDSIKSTGMSGLQSIFKTLQKYGYLVQKRYQDGHVDWFIADFPQMDNPHWGNSPQVEKPHVEKPHVDNPLVLIKKQSYKRNKKIVKKQPHLPQITIPADIDQELWTEFMASRRRLKASSSQTAIKILLTTLDKCVAAGFTRNEAISEAIERGWKSVKPEWLKNSMNAGITGQQKHEANKADLMRSMFDNNDDIKTSYEIIQ